MFILVQALVSENWGPLETGSGKVLIPLLRNTSRRVDGVSSDSVVLFQVLFIFGKSRCSAHFLLAMFT